MPLFKELDPNQAALSVPDAVDGVLLSQTANTAEGPRHAVQQLLPFSGFTGSICSLRQTPNCGSVPMGLLHGTPIDRAEFSFARLQFDAPKGFSMLLYT